MDSVVRKQIEEVIASESIQKVILAEEFYFQKGKDTLSKFIYLEVTDEERQLLLRNSSDYVKVKEILENDTKFRVFGLLLFSIIAYCDDKAYRKYEFNEYEDKRVLARASVYMNNWVEQLIQYKFHDTLKDGSIKNAIDYLSNPSDHFTMLSEDHRRQLTNNLFKKDYDKINFKQDFLDYFSVFNIEPRNKLNYPFILSNICYAVDGLWKDRIAGLVSPDSTDWLDKAVAESNEGNFVVLWNHRKPNGTTNTLKLLRQCIEENGFFRIFYTSSLKVNYIAEIIDFVTNQIELDNASWIKNYNNVEWYHDNFVEYENDSKKASWVYLARKMYQVNSEDYTDLHYYKSHKYPTPGNQSPIISYKNIRESQKSLEMQKKLNLLQYKKQIILQGPPGTGKTREAKLIAAEMLGVDDTNDLKNYEQFKLVQFHPSYTYEDFVRGIVAESNGDKIEYKNVDKTLAAFAEKALKNYQNSQKKPELVSKEIWVEQQFQKFKYDLEMQLEGGNSIIIKEGTVPKIIAIEESATRVNRYDNENDKVLLKDSDIIHGYIGLYLAESVIKIKENDNLSKSARSGMYYLYQNLIEKFKRFLDKNEISYSPLSTFQNQKLKNYVLIIDEINRANLSSVLGELIYALEYRGKAVDSMYAVEDSILPSKNQIILPPNLYIIGTMNTADRSVGHIDYAIRRRFAFVDVLPKKLADEEIIFKDDVFKIVSQLFIKNYDDYLLNENIELIPADTLFPDFKPQEVWLGHSYFIQKKEKNEKGEEILIPENFLTRIQYEIIPILEEYIKDGILKESAREIIKALKTSESA